jgi:hypothetical protein
LIRADEKRAKGGARGNETGEERRRRSGADARTGNAMVLATIGSAAAAAATGVAVLSPIFFTAAVFPYYYRALRRSDHRLAIALVFRWGVALFISLLAVGAFLPDRLASALPFAQDAVRTVEAWIGAPEAAPPADTGYLLWGMLAFLAASAASGGLLGFLFGATAIGGAASAAVFVFRHGLNLVQIAFVALPVWQLSLFVSAAFLVVPASVFVFARFFHIETAIEDWRRLRRYMYAGAGFFALSILLRYAAAGAWRSLVEKWTVH